jgi:cell wall-associated NlpC family hydrolase
MAKDAPMNRQGAPRKYRPGDIVFWSIDGTSGEAHVVGYSAKDSDVLVIAMGSIITEMDEANCAPTGSSEPPIGESYRRHYMKRVPGRLAGNP